MSTNLKTGKLITMQAEEIIAYLSSGMAERAALVSAVTNVLEPPTGWMMQGEYPNGEDDFFPVLCRFIPLHGLFHVALCCPDKDNPEWLLVFIANEGDEVMLLKQCDVFIPKVMNQVLSLTAFLHARGYLLNDIAYALVMESRPLV